LGLGQSHCGKDTQFGTGPFALWEEHSVWDWASHSVGKTLGLELDWSLCGKNTGSVCLRMSLGKILRPKKEQVRRLEKTAK